MPHPGVVMAVALLFGSIVLFLWRQEMFSDGHVGRFSRQSNAERPKNITALVAPAIGCMSLSVGFCALSAFVRSYSDPAVEEPSGFWLYWGHVLGRAHTHLTDRRRRRLHPTPIAEVDVPALPRGEAGGATPTGSRQAHRGALTGQTDGGCQGDRC